MENQNVKLASMDLGVHRPVMSTVVGQGTHVTT